MRHLAICLLATTSLPLALLPAYANPLDPTIVAGSAAVAGGGTANLTVNQTSDKAIIDWRSFDIAPTETTRFVQPSADAVVLNRVTGGEGPSQIQGMLQANGHVFLINPDGILVGKDATIDVGSLVATTHDLLDADFLAGDYRFTQSGNTDSAIVNLGTITVEDGGFAALVAPGVRNAGTITARLGKVGLASASSFALDLFGDGLIQLAIDDSTAGRVIDLATGQPLEDLVSNSGLLSAEGGFVQLSASAARTVINSVINNTGVIEADTIGLRNGRIVLGAATAGSKFADAPAQAVMVSGGLTASGHTAGETGGTVQITGEVIELTVATIDALGWNGGGTVLVGRNVGGLSGDRTGSNATTVAMDAATSIDASGLIDGSGGTVILWADGSTSAHGLIDVGAGTTGGNGGFAKTSGAKTLNMAGLEVQLDAAYGEAGTALFDPEYLIVDLTNASTFVNILNQGGTAILYGRTDYDYAGPQPIPGVSILADIWKTSGGTANLKVFGDPMIYIGPHVRIGSSVGRLNVMLDASPDLFYMYGYPYPNDFVVPEEEVFFYPAGLDTLWGDSGDVEAADPALVAAFESSAPLDGVRAEYLRPRPVDASYPAVRPVVSRYEPTRPMSHNANWEIEISASYALGIPDDRLDEVVSSWSSYAGLTMSGLSGVEDDLLMVDPTARIVTNGGTFSAESWDYNIVRADAGLSVGSEQTVRDAYNELIAEGYDFLMLEGAAMADSDQYYYLVRALDFTRAQVALPAGVLDTSGGSIGQTSVLPPDLYGIHQLSSMARGQMATALGSGTWEVIAGAAKSLVLGLIPDPFAGVTGAASDIVGYATDAVDVTIALHDLVNSLSVNNQITLEFYLDEFCSDQICTSDQVSDAADEITGHSGILLNHVGVILKTESRAAQARAIFSAFAASRNYQISQ